MEREYCHWYIIFLEFFFFSSSSYHFIPLIIFSSYTAKGFFTRCEILQPHADFSFAKESCFSSSFELSVKVKEKKNPTP